MRAHCAIHLQKVWRMSYRGSISRCGCVVALEQYLRLIAVSPVPSRITLKWWCEATYSEPRVICFDFSMRSD